MTENSRHGGKRQGAGRPALTEGEKTRSITVTLPERDIEYLEQAGGGNRSEGMRRIILENAELLEAMSALLKHQLANV